MFDVNNSGYSVWAVKFLHGHVSSLQLGRVVEYFSGDTFGGYTQNSAKIGLILSHLSASYSNIITEHYSGTFKTSEIMAHSYSPGDKLSAEDGTGIISKHNSPIEREIGEVVSYDPVSFILEFKFAPELLGNPVFTLPNVKHNPAIIKKAVEDLRTPDPPIKYGNGAECLKCKQYYPYAEESNELFGLFKCWACRNSW